MPDADLHPFSGLFLRNAKALSLRLHACRDSANRGLVSVARHSAESRGGAPTGPRHYNGVSLRPRRFALCGS